MVHKFNKLLGNSDITISAMGMGCWPIGGYVTAFGDSNLSYGHVDDKESLMALHTAYDHGVNYYDTADMYGAGHSEELLAKAFVGMRDKVVISTKFGAVFDPQKKRHLQIRRYSRICKTSTRGQFEKIKHRLH